VPLVAGAENDIERINTMKWLLIMAGYIILFVMITLLIKQYDRLPVVYWSQSQDKCVAMRINEEVCDCARLDEFDKYEKVWVK